jgi:hypothetical protein
MSTPEVVGGAGPEEVAAILAAVERLVEEAAGSARRSRTEGRWERAGRAGAVEGEEPAHAGPPPLEDLPEE